MGASGFPTSTYFWPPNYFVDLVLSRLLVYCPHRPPLPPRHRPGPGPDADPDPHPDAHSHPDPHPDGFKISGVTVTQAISQTSAVVSWTTNEAWGPPRSPTGATVHLRLHHGGSILSLRTTTTASQLNGLTAGYGIPLPGAGRPTPPGTPSTSTDAGFHHLNRRAAPVAFSPGQPERHGNRARRAWVSRTSALPDRVVGTGTAASCTSAAVVAAVTAGGVITFNCGADPVTITLTQTLKVRNSTASWSSTAAAR